MVHRSSLAECYHSGSGTVACDIIEPYKVYSHIGMPTNDPEKDLKKSRIPLKAVFVFMLYNTLNPSVLGKFP